MPVAVHLLVCGVTKTVEVPQSQLIAVGCPVPGPGRRRALCCARFCVGGSHAGAVHRQGFVQLLDEVIDVPVFVHVEGPDVQKTFGGATGEDVDVPVTMLRA